MGAIDQMNRHTDIVTPKKHEVLVSKVFAGETLLGHFRTWVNREVLDLFAWGKVFGSLFPPGSVEPFLR